MLRLQPLNKKKIFYFKLIIFSIDIDAMKLEQYRRDRNLSYAKLATHLGLQGINPGRLVHRWCKGSTPSSTNMKKIVTATEGSVQPNDFFQG